VHVVEFGRSHQDRPLISLQLSVQPGVNDPTKPEFLFTGGVHAREVIDSLATEMGQLTGLGTRRLGYNSYGTLVDSLYEEFGTYSFLEELYVGSFPDFFTRFNPTDPVLIENVVEKAIVASRFLLSDAAFMMVPEPATWLLFATGGALLMAWARQKRRR
jgi:hypothetical protein